MIKKERCSASASPPRATVVRRVRVQEERVCTVESSVRRVWYKVLWLYSVPWCDFFFVLISIIVVSCVRVGILRKFDNQSNSRIYRTVTYIMQVQESTLQYSTRSSGCCCGWSFPFFFFVAV